MFCWVPRLRKKFNNSHIDKCVFLRLKTKDLEKCKSKCIHSSRCMYVDWDIKNKNCYINIRDIDYSESRLVDSCDHNQYMLKKCTNI